MRTEITAQALPGGYSGAGSTLSFTAVDVTNKNTFRASGNDLLVVRNVHATLARQVTITSVADQQGRRADVVETLAAGVVKYYGPFRYIGWRNSSGFIDLEGEVDLQVAVIQL